MTLNKLVKIVVTKIPYVRTLYKESLIYRANANILTGHYSSPLVSVDDIQRREKEIWKIDEPDHIDGLNLNTAKQLELLNKLGTFYAELPFTAEKQREKRYYFDNDYYSYTDGIVLYSMMRYFKPRKIIEVGSGFSSALMMDTNKMFFDNAIDLVFVEPYPDRLLSLMPELDANERLLVRDNIQNVPLDVFRSLEVNDILFIDSSHVVKTGSDVNYILFRILPVLKKGVLIHFHDIFYPFEYPKAWVLGGFNWNENYFLRAFLMYNNQFAIILFSNYLHTFHKKAFGSMPLSYKNCGGNLWIQKQ